jgi:hypothetical protein
MKRGGEIFPLPLNFREVVSLWPTLYETIPQPEPVGLEIAALVEYLHTIDESTP